jgi:Diacylglycerol kinase accessory domain
VSARHGERPGAQSGVGTQVPGHEPPACVCGRRKESRVGVPAGHLAHPLHKHGASRDWARDKHTFEDWKLTGTPLKAAKLRRMQNYFSIGVDAEVARRFDAARTARPEQFRSALKNKMTYARLGLDLLVRGARSLEHRIEVLSIDGVAVTVPHGCKSIVFLNIPSFGAGTHPWGDGGDDGGDSACLPLAHRKRTFAKPAVDDGLLEVVALFGILDAARMHIPISLASLRGYGARRLGQGSAVEIKFRNEEQYKQFHPARKDPGARPGRGTLSVQVDGEAWPFPCWEESMTVTLQGKVGAPCGPAHSPRGGWPSARHADGYGNTVRLSSTAATDGVKHGHSAAFDSGPPSSRNFSTPEGRLREPVMA